MFIHKTLYRASIFQNCIWIIDTKNDLICFKYLFAGKPRFSAAVYAEPPQNQKVILYSSYKLADKRECWGENRG